MNVSKRARIFTAGAAISALAFLACGELDISKGVEDISTAASDKSDILDDLGICKSLNDGDIKYIASEDQYYHCVDGNWKEVNVTTDYVESSSSKKNSSSFDVDDLPVISHNKSSSSKDASSGIFDDDEDDEIVVVRPKSSSSRAKSSSSISVAESSSQKTDQGEESSPVKDPVQVSGDSWYLDALGGMLISQEDNIVTTTDGIAIGIYLPESGTIVDPSGVAIITGIDVDVLPVVKADRKPESSATVESPASSSAEEPRSSAAVESPASSATEEPPTSSASETKPKSSSATVTPRSSATISSSATVSSSASTTIPKSSDTITDPKSSAETEAVCTDGNKKYSSLSDKYYLCENGEWVEIPNENWQVIESSSSTAPKSSSSQQSNTQSLLPNIISGGKSGSGYATRYWDSCKPHCAWQANSNPAARACNTDGTSKASIDASSVCDGGNAGTCFDQAPQIVNDTIAYAFAATPGSSSECGKCYMLTFTGTGKYSTDDHHRKIMGKHLIVMANNIGYDVSSNQFDLMIPGGGPGAFNGCSMMGISCAGAQYGGFLTTCDYDKQCLIDMCNSEFKNESLRNGSLFLANWMDAANNPNISFVQVECPAALSAKY